MINSMTGFGRGQAEEGNCLITVEIKAVNHRFLEIYSRLPRQLLFLDDALKKQLQQSFCRGKFDVYVTFDSQSTKKNKVKVDKELLIGYYKALTDIAEYCNLPLSVLPVQLAGMNGVLSLEAEEDDAEQIARVLSIAAGQAAEQLKEMREVEGQALAADLLHHLDQVESLISQIAVWAPRVTETQRQKLEQRISELLSNIPIDESRLANELAFFADKVDISEELARLTSHISQFRATLADSTDAVGRKLEFILQEMLREINTVGSKSNTLEINQTVIEVKSELEKIREQIQNVQ